MRRILMCGLSAAALLLFSVSVASAFHLNGYVYCQGNGPVAGVTVTATGCGGTFSAVSGADGYYQIDFDGPCCYHASIDLGAGESSSPPSLDFCLTQDAPRASQDWTITGGRCGGEEQPGACWLTGGGTKKSPITDTNLGESVKGRKLFNWGGNVNPGCSPTAGDGGDWNLIDVAQSLHFHGTHIEVVRCDNIVDYPPGSTSPKTPFNFIEYTGWGTLTGIKGNKYPATTVYFFARAEDRNEPGSNGMRDGDGKDRLFVNVYTQQGNPSSSIILVDQDGNPLTIDPLIISTGNLQIHISSCDTPPVSLANGTSTRGNSEGGAPAPAAGFGSWGKLKITYR